jgi:hypothetical protein
VSARSAALESIFYQFKKVQELRDSLTRLEHEGIQNHVQLVDTNIDLRAAEGQLAAHESREVLVKILLQTAYSAQRVSLMSSEQRDFEGASPTVEPDPYRDLEIVEGFVRKFASEGFAEAVGFLSRMDSVRAQIRIEDAKGQFDGPDAEKIARSAGRRRLASSLLEEWEGSPTTEEGCG